MNKRNHKKGFTITELVIVIVVIAILAAVLIPTFASLIKKANQSADIQAARQMDTALQAESAVKKPDSLEAVIDILEEAGYDAEGSLKPITKNHKFYWFSTENVILLVNEEAEPATLLYPSDKKIVEAFAAITDAEGILFDLEVGFRQFVEVEASDAKAAADALNNGQSTTLTEDTAFEKTVNIPEGMTTTMDLGGNKVTVPFVESSGRSDYLHVYGTLIIKNGTFDARGIWVHAGGKLIVAEDSDIVVNSVDANGGAAVWVDAGAEVEINGGKFIAPNAGTTTTSGAAALYNDGGNVTINGGEFISNSGAYPVTNKSGTMTINNATITGKRGGIYAPGGTVTLNGGSVTNNQPNSAYAIYLGNGSLIVNGGTLSSAGHVLCVDGGTFTNNSSTVLVKDGKYYDFQ